MKFLDWRLSEDFESEEIGVTFEDLAFIRGTWSMKSFVFVVSFSLSWVIGNTILLKGVKVKLRKHFQVMLIWNSTPIQSFRVKTLEISYSPVNFFSDRDEVLLVSEKFVLTEELGIRQRELPTQWGIRTSNPTVVMPCASCPKYPTT